MRTAAVVLAALTAASGWSCAESDPGRHDGTATGDSAKATSTETGPGSLNDTVFAVKTTICGTTIEQRAVGVAVDRTVVATVAHVFSSAESFELEASAGRRQEAELIWLDRERDLALARLQEPVEHWLDLGTIGDGDDVRIVTIVEGEPMVETGRTIRHVTATLDGAGERAAIELDAAIDRGESGSPVVGPDGALVAMVFAAARGEDRGWAVDAIEIDTALAAADDGGSIALSC